MAVALKTQKMLWGRAASRCAICRLELVMDSSETDDESLVGEACHIVAQKEEGPRGHSPLTEEQRDKFSNLLLLCNVHHKQVDDQFQHFTVEKLQQIKQEHEAWVRSALDFDPQQQRDDELYAEYIDYWASAVKLDEWTRWASSLVSHGQPSIRLDMHEELEGVRTWLLSRVWPRRHKRMEAAFANFRTVAQDLCNVFMEHASETSGRWRTEKFYKIKEWDQDRYRDLLQQYEDHVGLVEDLALELTRAANFVCDMVRAEFIPSYRLKQGVVLVQSGPYEDLSYRTHRVEYRGEERSDHPYPGLKSFMSDRFSRDLHFGEKRSDA